MGCGAKIEATEPAMAAATAPAYQAAQPPPPSAPQIQYAHQPAYTHAAQMPAQGQAVPHPQTPPAQPETDLIGMLEYIGYLIIMSLPILGLVSSIVMGKNKTPTNRRNLARAMIVFNVIGIMIGVAAAIITYITLSNLAETLGVTISLFGMELFK